MILEALLAAKEQRQGIGGALLGLQGEVLQKRVMLNTSVKFWVLQGGASAWSKTARAGVNARVTHEESMTRACKGTK